MIWLAWRQFRAQAAIAAVALAGVCAALVLSRPHVVTTFRPSGSGELTGLYVWLRLLGTALVGLPAIIGAFWGAPLVAQEIEARTHRLAWTQTVTRTRWLTVKYAVMTAIAIVACGLYSLVFTWWSDPIDKVGNRVGTAMFSQRGIVPIGYTLFALSVGIFVGIAVCRTLPAMGLSLFTFFVVRLVVQQFVRPHLVTSVVANSPTFGQGTKPGWVLSTRTVDAIGNVIGPHNVESMLIDACKITRADPDPNAALAACAKQLGIHDVIRLHPPAHFWSLQLAETAIFVALAVVLFAASVRLLQRRS
jgi:hypothetical protein